MGRTETPGDRLARINIAYMCLRSTFPLWGSSRRTWSFSLPGPPGGQPAVPFSLLPITSLYPVLPPPPPRCIITSFCIWLPTGSVHGKPKALAAAQSTALLLILGRWFFFPPSFPIQISHVNDFVHSEKLKIIPLPSAKSELVLLRSVVMPCHEGDKVTKRKVFVHIHMHM